MKAIPLSLIYYPARAEWVVWKCGGPVDFDPEPLRVVPIGKPGATIDSMRLLAARRYAPGDVVRPESIAEEFKQAVSTHNEEPWQK